MHVTVVRLSDFRLKASNHPASEAPEVAETGGLDAETGRVPPSYAAETAPPRPGHRAPSPVDVIARALDGPGWPGGKAPRDPVSIIAESVRPRRPARADGDFWDVWLGNRDFLRRQALRFSGGNVADAEDALSEAMLKAAHAFNCTVVHNQRAWLQRLVHNACMDHYRANSRRNRLVSDACCGEMPVSPVVSVPHERTPEELLMATQKISEMQQAMSQLPGYLAEPLKLHLDEHSDAEIAECLHISREVVRKRRQMARALLHQLTGL